jgi:Ca2+-binding RTX toxin-like protein
MHGQFFFADFITNRVFALTKNGTSWTATEWTGHIDTDVGTLNSPVSFGEDARGNLYVVDFGGEVFQLTPQATSSDAGDTINAGLGRDQVYAGSGNDQVFGENGADFLYGMNGNDTLNGANGTDMLDGGAGNDVLSGGIGNDNLQGFEGNDTLGGGKNADTLDGGAGSDMLTGGNGLDRFVFIAGQANGDTIVDFAGNGANAGDSLVFVGYGSGATFTQLNATQWEIASADDSIEEIITFSNGASVHLSDRSFVDLLP